MKLCHAVREIPIDRITITGLLAGGSLLALVIGGQLSNRDNALEDGLKLTSGPKVMLEVQPESDIEA